MRLLLVFLLLLVTVRSKAAAEVHHVLASDDLRLLFDTDDELELQVAAASLRQGEVGEEDMLLASAAQAQVLSCVRALVEGRAGGLEGTRVAAEILSELTFPLQQDSGAAALQQRCATYRHSTPRQRVDRNEQARYIAHLGEYGDRVRTMLYRFIKPTTTCYGLSGRLSAGLLAAFGGDVALEYCAANNGRHWLQTALEGQAGYGVGALFTWRAGNYRYRMNYLGGPFTYTKTRHQDWALGFGLTSAAYGEEYAHQQRGIIIAIPSRHSGKGRRHTPTNRRVSAGLGAAYMRTWGVRAGLKFLPLGTRDQRLLSEYAALSQRDLMLEQATIASALRSDEKAVLQIEQSEQSGVVVVKFRLCSHDTSVCEELLGGRAFPLALIMTNLERLQRTQTVLQDKHDQARVRMIGAAIIATAAGAPITLKNAVGKFSRTAKILPSRWDGFDFDDKIMNADGRGIVDPQTPAGARQSLREFVQKIFDSRPVAAMGEAASQATEVWNDIFVKMGRERLFSKTLRVGIPAVAIVSGGVVTLLTSLKLAGQEIALEKLQKISIQQQEINQLLQNPYHEVIVHDRTVLLQSLHFLVSQH